MSDRLLISQWNRCQEMAEERDLAIIHRSDMFLLKHSRRGCLGGFETVRDLYHFLLGYAWTRKDETEESEGE